MKTLYLDLGMGAAGDMLTAALLELTEDAEAVLDVLNNAFTGYAAIEKRSAEKCGIRGTHVTVTTIAGIEDEDMHDHHHDHDPDHSHTSAAKVREFIFGLDLPAPVIKDALSVYDRIADAEAHVHGVTPENIHFHEVGSIDAMVDVVSVCYLINSLKPDSIIASPVHVGSGTVKCAHGILPVPAPAVAEILKGIPTYSTDITGELCTPTGAALLAHFVNRFEPMPYIAVEKTGYGCGTKDFPRANMLRALLGESYDVTSPKPDSRIIELACNIDDMTGEDLGFAAERLMELGARDAFFTHVTMKKGRPGVILSVLCTPDTEELMVKTIFKHTTTIGIRRYDCARYELDRETDLIELPDGNVRVKSSSGYGVTRSKPEYDDLSRIAKETDSTLSEVRIRAIHQH